MLGGKGTLSSPGLFGGVWGGVGTFPSPGFGCGGLRCARFDPDHCVLVSIDDILQVLFLLVLVCGLLLWESLNVSDIAKLSSSPVPVKSNLN